jgi:predicted dehydrogenase
MIIVNINSIIIDVSYITLKGRAKMEVRKIGVAIVGCGAIFQNHITPIIDNKNVDLLYLVDIDEEKVKRLANKYSCNYSVTIDDVLKDERVDVVHILTPHYLHYEMTKKTIMASKNVVLEKPATINLEDANKLMKLSKQKNKQIAVVFQNRYNPSSIEAKKIIESNELGKVKGMKAFITWKRDEDYYNQAYWRGKWDTEGGGLLINQAIHTLDLMRWFGGDIVSLKGHVDTRLLDSVIEVEDTADATIIYKNGAIGIFYGTNNYIDNSSIEIEIICEKGKLIIRDYALWQETNNQIQKIIEDTKGLGGKDYWGSCHKIYIDKVYKKLCRSETVDINIEEGLKTLELVQGIYSSSKENKYYNMRY